jgi:hypothetical protein
MNTKQAIALLIIGTLWLCFGLPFGWCVALNLLTGFILGGAVYDSIRQ